MKMRKSIFSVRALRPKEAQELSQIIRDRIQSLKYYNRFARESEVAKYTADSLIQSHKQEPGSVLVAIKDAKIIGFCISKYDDGLIWLSWIATLDEYRRIGAARGLLRALDSFANKRGVAKIWCDCRTANVSAKHLLASCGYTEICTVKKHWYGQDFILWEKFLKKCTVTNVRNNH